jgi:hypothetical protein
VRRPPSARYLLASSVGVLCAWWAIAQPASSSDGDNDAAAVAALRFAMAQHAEDAQAICVSVEGLEKQQAVLQALRREADVHPKSDCDIRAGSVSLCKTKRPALSLEARAIEWISKDEVLVEVQHLLTPERSGRRAYRVVREGTAWVALGQVIKDTPL